MSRGTIAALAAGAIVIAGCGSNGDPAPAACKEGHEAFTKALASAPGPVRLAGATRISQCLSKTSDGDEVQLIGGELVETASRLADQAHGHPESRAALELGYLIEAVHRGGEHTQGIHSELLRRLDQELALVDTKSAAYRRGARAGRDSG